LSLSFHFFLFSLPFLLSFLSLLSSLFLSPSLLSLSLSPLSLLVRNGCGDHNGVIVVILCQSLICVSPFISLFFLLFSLSSFLSSLSSISHSHLSSLLSSLSLLVRNGCGDHNGVMVVILCRSPITDLRLSSSFFSFLFPLFSHPFLLSLPLFLP